MTEHLPTLAILGGTGDLGTGMARRWSAAGYRVLIGSRSEEKALAAVADLEKVMAARGISSHSVQGMSNLAAAEAAEIAILTVPFAHQAATLRGLVQALQGKILVDATVPLVPPKVGTVQLPPEGSAAAIAQNVLGDGVRLVSAFQNVAAHHLQQAGLIDCDVLVCGDDAAAREAVIALAKAAGMRGLHAGPLTNAVAAEALTSVIIQINRRYGCRAGIRISGPSD